MTVQINLDFTSAHQHGSLTDRNFGPTWSHGGFSACTVQNIPQEWNVKYLVKLFIDLEERYSQLCASCEDKPFRGCSVCTAGQY